MKTFKRMMTLFMAITVVCALVACDGNTAETPANTDSDKAPTEKVVLKLGSQTAEDSELGQLIKRFKANVEEQTDGMVEIDVYYSSALGKLADMVEGVSMGTIDFVTAGLSSYQTYCDDMVIFDTYAFNGPEEFAKLIQSEPGQSVLQELRDSAGIDVIAYTTVGVGTTSYWSETPYTSLEDLHNVNIRSNGNKTTNLVIEALGAVPVTASNGEQYNAYQTGLCDMMSLDPSNMVLNGYLTEGMYQISVVGNFVGSTLAASDITFSKLTSEQQEIITACAQEAFQEYGSTLYNEKMEHAQAGLEEMGVIQCEFSDEDLAEIKNRVDKALYDYKASICDVELLDAVAAVLAE